MIARQITLALCVMLAMAGAVPQASATTHNELIATTIVIQSAGAPGCSGGAAVAFAALPGQPEAEQNIAGCQTIVFTKPAAADVHVAVIGGDNSLGCDWRPLQEASCAGVWVYHGSATKVQLTIRGGTPGAVTAVAR